MVAGIRADGEDAPVDLRGHIGLQGRFDDRVGRIDAVDRTYLRLDGRFGRGRRGARGQQCNEQNFLT